MGDIEFDVEESSIETTVQNFLDEIEDGMKSGIEEVLDDGKETAVSIVEKERRPYTTPHLRDSFTTYSDSVGDSVSGKIINPLEHAAYVDKGVSGTENQRDTPFSYDDSMPPLDEMIKFVKERMGGWNIDTDTGGGGGDSDSFGALDGDQFTDLPEDEPLVIEYESPQSDDIQTLEVNLNEKPSTTLVESGDSIFRYGEAELDWEEDGDRPPTRRVKLQPENDFRLEYRAVTKNGSKWRKLSKGEVKIYRRKEYFDNEEETKTSFSVEFNESATRALVEDEANAVPFLEYGDVAQTVLKRRKTKIELRTLEEAEAIEEVIDLTKESNDLTSTQQNLLTNVEVEVEETRAKLIEAKTETSGEESAETPSEGSSRVKTWNKYDWVQDKESGKLFQLIEKKENGYFFGDGENEPEFLSFEDAAERFDHSRLEVENGSDNPRYTSTYENLVENFANGRDWNRTGRSLSSLEEGEVVEFDVSSGTEWGVVQPESLQDDSTESVLVTSIAQRLDNGDDYDGKILNYNDFTGSDPDLTINDPKRVWSKENLESKPHPEGNISKEKLRSLDKLKETERLDLVEVNEENLTEEDFYEGQEWVFKIDTGSSTQIRKEPVYAKTQSKITFEDSGEYYLPNSLEENEEISIIGKDPSVSPHNLSENDDIVIDGDETDIDDWDGKNVLVGIDEISEGGYVAVVHDYAGGRNDVEIDTLNAYKYHRKDRPGVWDLKNTSDSEYRAEVYIEPNGGSGIEKSDVYNNEYLGDGIVKSGVVLNVSDSGKKYDSDGTVEFGYKGREGNYHVDTIPQDFVISVDDELTLSNTVDPPIPDKYNDVDWVTTFNDPINSGALSPVDYLVYDRLNDEYTELKFESQLSNDAALFKDRQTGEELKYYDSSSIKHEDSRVVPVATLSKSYFNKGAVKQVPRNSDGTSLFFYGQEVTLSYEGNTLTGYLTGWNEDYVQVKGVEGVDRIPLQANFDETSSARLEGFEQWKSLGLTEKREQLKKEYLFGIDYVVRSDSYLEKAEDVYEERLSPSFKDVDDLRGMLANTKEYSTFAPGSGQASYLGEKFKVKNEPKLDPDTGAVEDFNESTYLHEFEHILHFSKGYRGSTNGLTDLFSGASSVKYPDVDFNEDGTSNDPNIADLGKLMTSNTRDGETPSDINNVTFSDLDVSYNKFNGFDPLELEDSDYDTSVTTDDVYVGDGEESILSVGDILKVEQEDIDGNVEERILVSIDSESRIPGDGMVFWDAENETKKLIYDYSIDINGYYDASDEDFRDFEAVAEDWTPDSDDDFDAYYESANRSLKRRLWAINNQGDNQIGPKVTEINRPYASANTHETVTNVTEVMLSNEYATAATLTRVYKTNPEVIKQWLKIRNPSDVVENYINNNDELESLRGYL